MISGAIQAGGLKMNMAEAIYVCFVKYATFSGRARRAEYWWFFLFTSGVPFAIGFFEGERTESISLLLIIWMIAILVPSYAVAFRRLHDINRSGWWNLLPLASGVPLWFGSDILNASPGSIPGFAFLGLGVVFIVLPIVWLAWPGTKGANRFGPDPLRPDLAEGVSDRT